MNTIGNRAGPLIYRILFIAALAIHQFSLYSPANLARAGFEELLGYSTCAIDQLDPSTEQLVAQWMEEGGESTFSGIHLREREGSAEVLKSCAEEIKRLGKESNTALVYSSLLLTMSEAASTVDH